MAEERDEQVAAAYRALGAEEPPRALDEAILAAARRPVPKPWTRRYAVPLSLAAVLVLSITVTLRIQHEAPELEKPVPVREQAVAQAPAEAKEPVPVEQAPLKLKPEVQMKSAPVARAQPKPFSDAAPAAAPAAPAAPALAPAGQTRQEEFASRADQGRVEPGAGGAAMRQAEERLSRDAEAASRAAAVGPVQALAKRNREVLERQADVAASAAAKPAASAESRVVAGVVQPRPEAELERIAQLRAEGRHDEADKALADFRKRNPNFRIPEETLKRLERSAR